MATGNYESARKLVLDVQKKAVAEHFGLEGLEPEWGIATASLAMDNGARVYKLDLGHSNGNPVIENSVADNTCALNCDDIVIMHETTMKKDAAGLYDKYREVFIKEYL